MLVGLIYPQELTRLPTQTTFSRNDKAFDYHGTAYVPLSAIEPISRILDNLVTGIERQASVSREELGLNYLRERNDDKENIFEKALDTIEKQEAMGRKAKKDA